ncbi:MAG: metal ABC transporter permease [Polyangia bacterium]
MSIVIGVLSAFLGYYVSFHWSLPTGASMVIVASSFLFLAVPWLFLTRKR